MVDEVDAILDQWARERPEIDASSMAIFGRMARISVLVTDRYREFWKQHGLAAGEFDVLATLRRAGNPYTLTAGDLSRSLMVTGGAITARIDRLVRKDLASRREDPANRRSMLISLTESGFNLIDGLVPAHVENQQRMLAGLSQPQREHLSDLLRQLLTTLETEDISS